MESANRQRRMDLKIADPPFTLCGGGAVCYGNIGLGIRAGPIKALSNSPGQSLFRRLASAQLF